MALIEIRIRVSLEEADRLDEVLSLREVAHWNILQNVEAGITFLQGYFESEDEADTAWANAKDIFFADSTADIQFQKKVLEDEDWRESYKEHFKSWRFRGLHWVPLWEKESYVVPDGEAVVWLDPGMAFGTGNHETTRLCVERLVEYASRQIDAGIDLSTMDIVDAGCGSGILILSASELGFEKLRAFDNDAEAVRISEENATMNNASNSICFEVADLTNGFNAGKADFLMANILANILAENAIKLIDALKPGAQLVLSGILTREVDEVRAAFAVDSRVEECGSRDLGEWSDLVFNRTKNESTEKCGRNEA